jgi:hypothetical protein
MLQHLDREPKFRSLRLGHQQVNMLGHNHIARDIQTIPSPHTLQRVLEHIARLRSPQPRRTLITAKREEVQASCFLKPLQSPGHVEDNRNPGGEPRGSIMRESLLNSAIGNGERKSNSPPCRKERDKSLP